MKSKYQRELCNGIARLNNHLSHYFFLWEQFRIDNSSLILSNQSKRTTQVYPTNPMAAQFDIVLSNFYAANRETHLFILRSFFLLCFAHYEEYQRELYACCRKANPSLSEINVRDTLPEKIFEYLGVSYDSLFTIEERNTISYLKLRRNQIMHGGGASKGEIKEIIRQKGTTLTRFWNAKLTNGIRGIDFAKEDLSTFSFDEIIDIINIVKVISEKIDIHVLKGIRTIDLLGVLKSTFMSEGDKNALKAESHKLRKKFSAYCRMNWSYNPTLAELNVFFP